jgi:uncharacterized protein YciI
MKALFPIPYFKLIFALSLFVGMISTPAFCQGSSYDAALAEKLGADQRGMKKYVMAFLYRGERVAEYTPEQRAEIQKGHMAHITKMSESGKLVMAGPFFGNDELRGIFVFDAASLEEATDLTNADPAVNAGVLRMDLKEWYGSAALLMMSEIHSKLTKLAN